MSALRTELCCRRQRSAAFGAGTPERRCAFLAELRSDLILVLALRTLHGQPEGAKTQQPLAEIPTYRAPSHCSSSLIWTFGSGQWRARFSSPSASLRLKPSLGR